MTTSFKSKLTALLTPDEKKIFSKLSSPKKVQDFLDSFPVLHLGRGAHSMKGPREVLRVKAAHCMEGAMFAAAALAFHGREPLLMDIQASEQDEDHVIALFKENNHWGAISKTNHPVLRWRDPVYKSVRELAMSYYNEYFIWWQTKNRGMKSMTAYSKPFNLSRFNPEKWVTAKGNLDWLAEALDDSPHYPALPKGSKKFLRHANKIEMRAAELEEWPEPKKK